MKNKYFGFVFCVCLTSYVHAVESNEKIKIIKVIPTDVLVETKFYVTISADLNV